jgi:NAD+ kinase
MRIALVTNPTRPHALGVLERLRARLGEAGHETWAVVDPGALNGLGTTIDVAVTLGGDGTLLWAANEVAPSVPVLGINLGHLGYLARFGVDEIVDVLAAWPGSVHIERRSTLCVTLCHQDVVSGEQVGVRREVACWRAVNDAVLERSTPGRVVRLAVDIARLDGDRTLFSEQFLTMAADGLIFATPTGSTAYNLSMRGPIVSPDCEAMVLTPIAPHATFDRSIVFGPQDRVEVSISGRGSAAVVIDGRVVADLKESASQQPPGTVPVVCVAVDTSSPMHLVVRPNESFVGVLRRKFGVAADFDQLSGSEN